MDFGVTCQCQLSALLAKNGRKFGKGFDTTHYVMNFLFYVLLAEEKSYSRLLTNYFLRGFCNFCKVSRNINYMVVGIIVRITHLKINLI